MWIILDILPFVLLFILLCFLMTMLCPFVWSADLTVAFSLQQDIQCHLPGCLPTRFSLTESVGTRSFGGTGPQSSLLSFDCRPTAEPEGAHHLPGCGARSRVHSLAAVGQWHYGPAAPGEVGLPLGQPPTEHLKLHQQILDIPRAGWAWGPHARYLLLRWVSLKWGWSFSFPVASWCFLSLVALERLVGFPCGAVHLNSTSWVLIMVIPSVWSAFASFCLQFIH